MEIRPARLADAAPLASVHVRSWQGAYRGLLPQSLLDGLDPARRVSGYQRLLGGEPPPRGGILVAGEGGSLLGFVTFGPTRDEDEDPESTGEVAAIYVLPGACGTGCGRALMAGALAGLTTVGFRQATLWVLDANQRARRFYEAGGWQPDGAIKQEDFAGTPLHEVRYRRPLP